MKRIVVGTFLMLCMGLGLIAVAPATAQAQVVEPGCLPGSNPGYPPVSVGVALELIDLLDLELTLQTDIVSIVIGGLEPGDNYCGILSSDPIELPEVTADANGQITFQTPVGPDFELDALHHLDVFKMQKLVGAFDFCINRAGKMAPMSSCLRGPQGPQGPQGPPGVNGGGSGRVPEVLGSRTPTGGGKLARTGSDHLLDIARIGLVLIAAGATARYVQRRRNQRTA
ncbi:MAG: hypothetical protein M3Z03_03460 [Actinomycetota bacterium]|nr:hypothetical protein [Actinomycetota bacterium]